MNSRMNRGLYDESEKNPFKRIRKKATAITKYGTKKV